MMRKFLAVLLTVFLLITGVSACSAEQDAGAPEPEMTDAAKFKREYEIMNGQMSMDGSSVYQELEIPEENPIVYTQVDDIRALLTEGTGILYLGFPECPWCRTLIPVLLEAAETTEYAGNIYYYNALYDRDKKSLDENGNIVTENEGTEAYQVLLEMLDEYLWAYEGLNDPTVKRVYFPMTVFVKDGEVIASHIDTVEGQEDGYAALTEEQHAELLQLLSDNIATIMAE